MTYSITQKGLAFAAKTLIEDPNSLGELCEAAQHQAFLKDIAQVIADHCGGNVLEIDMESSVVQVGGNDSLPDPVDNVWTAIESEQVFEMYLFIGRVPGDDEDEICFVRAKDYDAAETHFLGELGVDPEKARKQAETMVDDEPLYFVNAEGTLADQCRLAPRVN